jgi:hypothetical protein
MFKKIRNKFMMTGSIGLGALAMSATSAFAANDDLDSVTTSLVTGVGDINSNFLTLIAVIVPLLVLVVGVGWLMGIFKKKTNKAN